MASLSFLQSLTGILSAARSYTQDIIKEMLIKNKELV